MNHRERLKYTLRPARIKVQSLVCLGIMAANKKGTVLAPGTLSDSTMDG